ncbi:hypothetical protein Tco_0317316 [Tanacetum coccineum]
MRGSHWSKPIRIDTRIRKEAHQEVGFYTELLIKEAQRGLTHRMPQWQSVCSLNDPTVIIEDPMIGNDWKLVIGETSSYSGRTASSFTVERKVRKGGKEEFERNDGRGYSSGFWENFSPHGLLRITGSFVADVGSQPYGLCGSFVNDGSGNSTGAYSLGYGCSVGTGPVRGIVLDFENSIVRLPNVGFVEFIHEDGFPYCSVEQNNKRFDSLHQRVRSRVTDRHLPVHARLLRMQDPAAFRMKTSGDDFSWRWRRVEGSAQPAIKGLFIWSLVGDGKEYTYLSRGTGALRGVGGGGG